MTKETSRDKIQTETIRVWRSVWLPRLKILHGRLGWAMQQSALISMGRMCGPKIKELIEAAIQKLGYVRNEYARGLKRTDP